MSTQPEEKKPVVDGFTQRFKHYVNVTDPRTLIYSDERIKDAKAICDIYEDIGKPQGEEYLKNKKICDAAIHPVTGEIIPKIFRVSAIAPVNIPLVFAMITCPAANIPGTLFLHWLNQSYNTACNYANRAGADQSIEQTAKAYGLAVTSACAFAYGLGKLAARGKGGFLTRFSVIIPCIATGMANVSNVGFTRADEILNGAPVFDKENDKHGVSKIAGTQGVFQTAMTRCLLVPMSCLLLPPIAMSVLGKANMLPGSSKGKMAVEISIIYLALQGALPAALAVFPQKAEFPVSKLEPQFHNLNDKNSQQIEFLYSNKGL